MADPKPTAVRKIQTANVNAINFDTAKGERGSTDESDVGKEFWEDPDSWFGDDDGDEPEYDSEEGDGEEETDETEHGEGEVVDADS